MNDETEIEPPAPSRIERALEAFCELVGLRGPEKEAARIKASNRIASQTETGFSLRRAALWSEALFYGGRSKADVKTTDRRDVERIAIDHHTVEKIVDDKSIASLLSRITELTGLERIAQAIEVTSRLDPLTLSGTAQDNIDNVRNQDWLVQVKLKKFLCVKAILCIRKGFNLTINNLNEHMMPDKELRREDIRIATQILLREAFVEACSGSKAEFAKFVRDVAGEMLPEDEIPLPEVEPDNRLIIAPELFRERKNSREDPYEFVVRVYTPYVGRVDRADIRRLDEPLYRSLYRWLNYRKSKGEEEPPLLERILPKTRGRRAADKILPLTEPPVPQTPKPR